MSRQEKVSEIIHTMRLNTINTFKYHLQDMKDKIHPKYRIIDVTDENRYRRWNKSDENLVEVEFNPQRKNNVTTKQRRMNRAFNRYARYPPLNLIANMILENKLFQILIVCCVILSLIILIIEAEFKKNMNPVFKFALQTANWIIFGIFILEILLKWLDSFRSFWQSNWNIFDLTITVMAVVPEILPEISHGAQHWLKLLIQFRTLRFFKILFKFREVNFILKTIIRIFKGPQFTMMFLVVLILFYIFAVLGVYIFAKYTSSTVPGLLYQKDFKDVYSSLNTLFSIFTMDHCSGLLEDMRKVPDLNYYACVVFIVSWYLLAAVSLSNITLGLFADSFYTIRCDLCKEVKQLKIQNMAKLFKDEIMCPNGDFQPNIRPSTSQDPEKDSKEAVDWEKDWEVFFEAMEYRDENEPVTWHEDSLYKYLRLQERLQCNIEATVKLQNQAAQVLLNLDN